MRAPVSPFLAWLVVGLTVGGCEYVEPQPGSSSGQAGALGDGGGGSEVGATTAQAGAGSDASPSTTTGTTERSCQRVCIGTTQSGCTQAETNLEVCTTNCEATLEGSCGSAFADYLICAQDGGEITCSYGPVVEPCQDLFWGFIDCAGLEL